MRSHASFAVLLLLILLSACLDSGSGNKTAPPAGSEPETPVTRPLQPGHPDTDLTRLTRHCGMDFDLEQLPTATSQRRTILNCLLDFWGVQALEYDYPDVSTPLHSAGQVFFSSTRLSGPGNVSCASCHTTGGAGVERSLTLNRPPLHASAVNAAETIHRNAPDLVNRLLGHGSRKAMFWDGRVAINEQGGFTTPAGDQLPEGLDNLLAALSLFPLLSRDEMLGSDNALADLVAADASVEANPWPVWNAIMARVRTEPALAGGLAYLQAANPEVDTDNLSIRHLANALAAHQTRRWNGNNEASISSPPTSGFHAYLAFKEGLSSSGMNFTTDGWKGALLFFGEAGCARCHQGPLLTDGRYHNLAIPQIGPGFGKGATMSPSRDQGRFEITGQEQDRFAFLTPSLWEVPVTDPYTHNGVYTTLAETIRHHLAPASSALAFRCSTDQPAGVVDCQDSESAPALYQAMVDNLTPLLADPPTLTDTEIRYLVAFLKTLTTGLNGSVLSD